MKDTQQGLMPSCATAEDQMRYMEGDCHLLAVALHRNLGWRMQAQLDQADPFWQDEADPDNFIANVLHVYAMDGKGNAWDVKGVRPQSLIEQEMEDLFSPQDPSSDEMRSEGELKTYVGCWAEGFDDEDPVEEIERPLGQYDDQDIERAWQVAQRIFAGMEGFAPSAASSTPRRVSPR
jgi:hypothetical protein